MKSPLKKILYGVVACLYCYIMFYTSKSVMPAFNPHRPYALLEIMLNGIIIPTLMALLLIVLSYIPHRYIREIHVGTFKFATVAGVVGLILAFFILI